MYKLSQRMDIMEKAIVGSHIEGFSSAISDEAIQNIASLYNNAGTLTVPNVNVVANTTTKSLVASSFNLLPTGIIVAWNGTNIPAGWAACDGTNGTPNLQSRFILGSGSGAGLTVRQFGSTGGEEVHTLTVNEMPSHAHTTSVAAGGGCQEDITCQRGTAHWKLYDFPVPFPSNAVGGSAPHNIMPPFYTLMYIMKL